VSVDENEGGFAGLPGGKGIYQWVEKPVVGAFRAGAFFAL